MENIIEIKNLSKSFGDVKAVRDLSFCVKKGELFAFLGVNGAGKSTTISIMCSVLPKDSGSVLICGHEVFEQREKTAQKLGVVFQNSVLDRHLSVKDNLESRAALYGLSKNEAKKRIAELSVMLDFEEILGRTVGKLSGGQRRRIDVARALLHRPEILVLDEPTTGLDPQTRRLLWNVVKSLREKENMTVFLTTHYMEEAADADYVVILDSGKISAEGTPLELKNKYTGDFITFYSVTREQLEAHSIQYEKIGDGFRTQVKNTEEATQLILKYPELFTDYEIIKGKMDDVFLSATGKKLTGGEE